MSKARTMVRSLRSVPLLGLVLFAFSVGFPPFDDAATIDLTIHMAQHILIMVAGVLVAYPLYKKGYFGGSGRIAPSLGALALVALIAFWHLPFAWDAAVLNPAIHAAEHLTFFADGFLIGSVLQKLQDRTKIELLVLGFFANFFYGWLLISSIQLYPLYQLAQQAELGLVMFITGPMYWIGIIYLVLRNPIWLREGQQESPQRERTRGFTNLSRFRSAVPFLTVLLLAVLVGFYGVTAIAITYAPGQQQGRTSVVYVVETPISWQYSPQSLRVVIGENNTVTWVSHSISYDTITANDGSFSSGPLAPGQTYSHTFNQQGTYEYHCVYHPWMVGYITVAPKNPS